MLDKMKQLWEMKQKVDEIKKQLDGLLLETEDEFVKIAITGSQEIKSVTLKSPLENIDKAKLEKSLAETFNRAVKQSQKSAAEKMSSVAGLGIPGLS